MESAMIPKREMDNANRVTTANLFFPELVFGPVTSVTNVLKQMSGTVSKVVAIVAYPHQIFSRVHEFNPP